MIWSHVESITIPKEGAAAVYAEGTQAADDTASRIGHTVSAAAMRHQHKSALQPSMLSRISFCSLHDLSTFVTPHGCRRGAAHMSPRSQGHADMAATRSSSARKMQ